MRRKLPLIEVGFQVFLRDGGPSFGAVRRVVFGAAPQLEINVEGGGDFRIPLDAVAKVAAQRVVLRWSALPTSMQEAIRHAADAEDFPPPDGEVELVRAAESEDGDENYAWRHLVPLDEGLPPRR
jgi:hypothetical protein